MATKPPSEGVHKAAIVLRNLSQRQRTRLLGLLEPQQAAAVTAEMNGLPPLGNAEQEAVVREFAKASGAGRAKRRPARTAPFRFANGLPTEAMVDLLDDEHPQATALVMSYLAPEQAAKVLAKLTPEKQIAVISCIATADEPSPEVVRDVDKGLKRRLFDRAGRRSEHRGIASAVRILNVMEPAIERRILSGLAEADPQLIGELRRAIFGADVAACQEWGMAEMAG